MLDEAATSLEVLMAHDELEDEAAVCEAFPWMLLESRNVMGFLKKAKEPAREFQRKQRWLAEISLRIVIPKSY